MKIILAAGLSALALLAVSACTDGATSTVTGTTKIDRSFQVGGVTWSGDAETLTFIKARNRGGEVEVCGAISTAGPGLYRSGEQQVLQGTYLRINGQTVANQIHYFNRLPQIESVEEAGSVLGQEARCATTGVPWRDAFEGAEIDSVLRSRSVQL